MTPSVFEAINGECREQDMLGTEYPTPDTPASMITVTSRIRLTRTCAGLNICSSEVNCVQCGSKPGQLRA